MIVELLKATAKVIREEGLAFANPDEQDYFNDAADALDDLAEFIDSPDD